MPRPLRLDHPGAHFHVTSRGNERQTIYADRSDRLAFLHKLTTACRRYGAVCHAYCLMDNHYHLLVESAAGRLSEAMQHLNGSYGRYFNRRWDRNGHLFQGRFNANLIDRDHYLLGVVRYIELNPNRAGLVADPADWHWSSYRPRMGLSPAPLFLCVDEVLRRFGTFEDARARYRTFILAGVSDESLRSRLMKETIIGPPDFVKRHAERARQLEELQKIPRRQRLADRPDLSELLAGVSNDADGRRRAAAACVGHGYKMTEIARYLGVHYTTVSRWVHHEPCDNS